ncbi:hypothetical protein JHK82_052735 [Glycine max]|nr:hypothetical protein JHK86_052584 [Glycine max]KAG4926947.1 hypothetical protein JHK85_053433 [Glycine max]KAG5082583.1 hypothetical protein JHK84_052621 [Glycine max]KAG5085338.1 hypothetical protein JHK82_052735 [Glycine max]
MACSPDKIKIIDGSKETLKLAMRISDLWFVGMPDKSEQAEMVFVDCDSVLDDLPFRKYRFAGFANVVAGQFEPGLLVDIIGVVDEVVFRHVLGKGRRVVFKLKDLRLAELDIETRYRLEVMVNHRDESTKFLLWDRECTKLIGQSADANNRLKIEIKVQPKFRNSAILKCSTDSSLIDVVMDMLPDAETSSKINVPVFGSNDPTQHEFQSMSVTGYHDPLLGLPLTPTKRQTFHDCDDEARSSQISPT